MASRVYYPLQKITWPIIWAINLVAGILVRLTGVRPDKDDEQDLTVAELRTLVAESGRRIPSRRRQMLLAVLELEALTIEDIMTPRGEIEAINLVRGMAESFKQLRAGTTTRYCPAIAVSSTTWRACCMCASCFRQMARTAEPAPAGSVD